jgi:hypothetical protein
MLLEMNAVKVPVTAKVQRISTNCAPFTFHFFCKAFNMLQREEKNECVVNFFHLIILIAVSIDFNDVLYIQQNTIP